MAVDVSREIRRAVDTGKVVFGTKRTEKNVLQGDGKLIILSKNAPKQTKEKISHLSSITGIPFYEYNGNGLNLGSVCGKPFVISALLVKDVGKSKILSAVKE